MSDNKKYYYLKLKENFYEGEEMVILQNMADGYLYSDILMKLYLKSLKNDGKLMFKDRIPYSPTILANVVRHSVGVVEKALSIFRELELIEILDNGAIFILDIQNFIGESSSEADRKRIYRNKIEHEKLLISGQMSRQMSDKCPDKNPPEIRDKSIEYRDKIKDVVVIDKDPKTTTTTIFKFYNDNFGMITPFVAQSLDHWLNDGVEEALIMTLMQEAVKNNVSNYNYVDTAIKNNFKKNIKTLEQYQANEVGRKNKKDVKQQQSKLPENFTNYNQREYASEDFKKFYKNLDEGVG